MKFLHLNKTNQVQSSNHILYTIYIVLILNYVSIGTREIIFIEIFSIQKRSIHNGAEQNLFIIFCYEKETSPTPKINANINFWTNNNNYSPRTKLPYSILNLFFVFQT